MLEPIAIDVDLDAILGVVDDTSFSPVLNKKMAVDEDEIVDFNDPVWDTLFAKFDQDFLSGEQNAKHSTFEPLSLCSTSLVSVVKVESLIPVVKVEAKVEAKPEKRKREECNVLRNTKCLNLSGNVISSLNLDLFAAPRHTWSVAKQKRFDAMQRLQTKRCEGRFGAKPSKKSHVRKKLANKRKRTSKGQFARTSKFKWVSVCDLQG